MALSSRTLAALAAALIILPAFTFLSPTANAAGTEIATDLEGDNAPYGPDTDILRLGGSNDATYMYFFIQVKDISVITEENGYQVQFQGPQAQPNFFNVIVHYGPTGFTGAEMHKDTDPLGTPVEVFPVWIGNELRIGIKKTDIGPAAQTANGKILTNIIAETWPASTGMNVDQTTIPGSYTFAAGGSTTPNAPVVSAAGYSNHVLLTWPAPYNGGATITSYNVYGGTTSGSLSLLGSSGTTSYDDLTVTSGLTYYYQVSAVNSQGEGPRSAQISVVAVDPSVPDAVQALVAQGGDATVTLAWQAPASNGGSAITNYRVYKNGVAMTPDLGPVLLKTVTGLQNGQSYTFRVSAINSVGEGPLGAQVSATPSNALVPVAFEEYLGPGNGAGEPSLGIDQVTGAVYYTDGFTAYKVTSMTPNNASGQKGTATWTDMDWPYIPTAFSDPIGFLDRDTNRYFHAQILVPPDCSQMLFTDNAGATWQQSTGACESGNGHDHETVGGGPFRGALGPAAGSTYPNSVYYCAQGNVRATCAISLDGGVTFQPARSIYNTILNVDGPVTGAAPGGFCSNLHGHVKVAPDGVVAVPVSNCYKTGQNTQTKGGVYSLDDGQHWNIFSVPGSTQWNGDFDPSVHFSEDKAPGAQYHRMWYAYTDGDHKMKATYSDDLGTTWGPIVNVGASLGLLNTEFAQIVTGDHDRAAVAFLGTPTGGDNQATTFNGVWHAYVAVTYNSGATWQLTKVSVDPVQKGCISAGGTTSTGCRNLLDFNDVQISRTGQIGFAYADGCTSAACKTETPATNSAAGSTNDAPGLAFQIAGRGLLRAFDNSVTVPEAPGLVAAPAANKVVLSWTVPANGNSAITGYDLFRDNVLIASVGAAILTYQDTGLTNGVAYTYEVAAKNAIGSSPRSLPVIATPQVDLEAPEKVLDLLVSSAGQGQVSLVWDPATDNLGVDHYVVLRDGASPVSIGGATTSATITGLQNGRTYSFAVKAVDASGNEGPLSDAVTARPVRQPTAQFLASDPAGDSTGVAATDLRTFSFLSDATKVRLEWTAQNLAAGPGANKNIFYVATFAVGGLKYDVEYDSPGTRCHAYHNVEVIGLVGIRGVCANAPGNMLVAEFDRSQLEAQWFEGDPITITDIASGTITLNPTTQAETGSTENDAMADPPVYLAGSPASAQPPTLTASDQTGAEGALLSFTVTGSDPNGDHIEYTATGLPAGATLNVNTGDFAWTPSFTQAGAHVMTIKADTGAASTTKTITLTIANVDQAPVIQPIGPQSVNEGQMLQFAVIASDPDGEAVTLTHTTLPGSATFSSGTFTWATGETDAGDYVVTFTATSGGLSSFEDVAIHVENVVVNHAPILGAIGNHEVGEEELLSFTVSATDEDGDILTYNVVGLPGGATFDTSSGAFAWTPALGESGNYYVTFGVTDGLLDDSEDIVISVGTVIYPPVIDAVELQTASQGSLITVPITGSDPDGDALTFSLVSGPAGMTFASDTISWTPSYTQLGAYTATVRVDAGTLSDTMDIEFNVLKTPRAPVLNAISPITVVETNLVDIRIRATHPSGDQINLTMNPVPLGATFTDHQNGTARFTWTPAAGQKGTYTPLVTAESFGLTAERIASITVLQKTALTLVATTTSPVKASPSTVVTITATLTNTGTAQDTFRLTPTNTANWATTTPFDVILGAGASEVVTFTMNVPANGAVATARLKAESVGNPTVTKTIAWTVSVPLTVTVTFTKATFAPGEAITGTVTAKFQNDAPAVGAAIRLTQTPATFGSTFATTATGVTGAAGTWAFTLGEPGALLPGTHSVAIVATGWAASSAASSYLVSP